MSFSFTGAAAIYKREMMRAFRTVYQSILAPVLTTSLYFIVFGGAIGSRMPDIGGVDYAAFIIPGLLMLTLLGETTSNSSFGIYMPRFTGTIYELLSAPIGVAETLIGFVGAAATKSLILAAIILTTASFFVEFEIKYPLFALGYIVLVAASFSLFGFILGIWADSFEKLGIIPVLILTPLTFLGGTFYSLDMLPAPWNTIALLNPIAFLVSGLRWTFYGTSDVSIAVSLALTLGFLALCTGVIAFIFKTGWRLREYGLRPNGPSQKPCDRWHLSSAMAALSDRSLARNPAILTRPSPSQPPVMEQKRTEKIHDEIHNPHAACGRRFGAPRSGSGAVRNQHRRGTVRWRFRRLSRPWNRRRGR